MSYPRHTQRQFTCDFWQYGLCSFDRFNIVSHHFVAYSRIDIIICYKFNFGKTIVYGKDII